MVSVDRLSTTIHQALAILAAAKTAGARYSKNKANSDFLTNTYRNNLA